MLGYLILLFTVVPVVELFFLIRVGQIIGAGSTIFLVIFTGVLGAYLARLQGLITLYKIQEEVNTGVMPTERLLDGLIILASGILLLTPGFITDAIGFMGLIPSTRNIFKQWIRNKIKNMIDHGDVIEVRRFKSW